MLMVSFCTFLQCTIAHALEKTKYPNSDIYLDKFDSQYHFSCQFTADLIAMNHTDFIITSTFQEIAGRWILCILITVGDHCVAATKQVSDACCVVFAARTLLGNMSPTLHLHFLGSTVLSMALMFLIPSSISSLLEQTWVCTTHTLKLTRDSLPSTLRLRSSFTAMLRTRSTSEYWTYLSHCNVLRFIFMSGLGLSIYWDTLSNSHLQ